MSAVLERTDAFDATDRLNEDGTVTIRLIPSNWHAFNVSPDTYQMFNGEGWEQSHIEWMSEDPDSEAAYLDRPLTYDDFNWTYDHAGIVRDLATEAANWIVERLWDLGLESVTGSDVLDSWSPKFYNFTSDGFEFEITCDPAELRALTPDFDVDDWGHKHYRSRDGFLSYVTGRLDDEEWRAGYDGEFRVESLLASGATRYEEPDAWKYRLWEAEWEIYSEHVQVEFKHPEYMDSGYSLPELEEWAASLAPTQAETLPGV